MIDWLSVLIGFLGTFVGVGLAFGLTYWYDRHVKMVETRETKVRILKAISLEYQMILQKTLGESVEDKTVKLVWFSTLAVDSSVGSGDLSLLDPKIQQEIGEMGAYFKQVEMYSGKILSMIGSVDMSMSNAPAELAKFRVSLSATEDILRVRMQEVIKDLENEVTRLKG